MTWFCGQLLVQDKRRFHHTLHLNIHRENQNLHLVQQPNDLNKGKRDKILRTHNFRCFNVHRREVQRIADFFRHFR